MPTKGSKLIRVAATPEQATYITDTLDAKQRLTVLIDAADRLTGKRWRELTADLSEQNCTSLNLWPMFVGGDTSDMDTFLVDVWKRPVTDENIRQVFETFNQWYKLVAPDEYHEPTRPQLLRDWLW